MIFRKDKWALRRVDARCDSCDKVCLGVALTSCPLSCNKSQSSLVNDTSWDTSDNRVPLEDLSLGREEIQRKPIPAFAISQGSTAQNNIPKPHILGKHILLSFMHIIMILDIILFTYFLPFF